MVAARPVGRFSAKQRIRRRAEFRAVQNHGRRVTTPHFVFLIEARAVEKASDELPRLGITASRKVGGAVIRNRAKRLVREAFRATRDLWRPGIDLVVIVRRALIDMGLNQVVAEWRVARVSLERMMDQAERARERALPLQPSEGRG